MPLARLLGLPDSDQTGLYEGPDSLVAQSLHSRLGYSSEGNSRSLFYTTEVPALRKVYRDRDLLHDVSDDARLIVSEPLGDVAGVWNEAPESSYGVVGPGRAEIHPFEPKVPSAGIPVPS